MLGRGARFACAEGIGPKEAHLHGAIFGYASRRLFSSSSSALKNKTDAPEVTVTQQTHLQQEKHPQHQEGGGRRRKRHRHRFNNFTDEIPSFQEFQQQQQVRSLYRKFTRLVFQKAAASTRIDLQRQIRHEFRLHQSDAWHVKRSLSEGNRRYKELTAMLGSSVVSANNNNTSSSDNQSALPTEASVPASSTGNWPWNRPSSSHNGDTNGTRKRPLPFPRKSNL